MSMSQFRFNRWHIGMWFGWGLAAFLCTAYGVFAVAAGLNLAESEKTRALPLAFEIHALAGGIVLIAGIFQFNPALRTRMARLHVWGGRIYVAGVCLASIAAVVNAAFFPVGWPARLSFSLLGLCWLAVTAIAYRMIRKRNYALHREWMLRSVSLSLFFVTFSFWVPVLAGTGSEQETVYFVAVTLSWTLNLLAAEIWIRWARATPDGPARRQSGARGAPH